MLISLATAVSHHLRNVNLIIIIIMVIKAIIIIQIDVFQDAFLEIDVQPGSDSVASKGKTRAKEQKK